MYLTVQRLHKKIYFIPMALFAIDLTISLLALLASTGMRISFYFFTLGIFFSWVSVLTGFMALFSIRWNEMAFSHSLIHGFINMTAVVVLTVLWANELPYNPDVTNVKAPVVIIKVLTIAMLVIGARIGRRFVRKYL